MSEPLQRGFIEIPMDDDSCWWWEALAQEHLLFPHCRACDRHFFPPQPTCPYCGSDGWSPDESSGRATVYSWIVAHLPLHPAFENDVPYTIVAGAFDEGVRIFGRLKDDGKELVADAPLQAYFYEVGGRTLLGFELASEFSVR